MINYKQLQLNLEGINQIPETIPSIPRVEQSGDRHNLSSLGVGGLVKSDTELFSHQQVHRHWVERYWVERSGNKYYYFRYCFIEGGKRKRKYLGSSRSKRIQALKQKINDLIIGGKTQSEIISIIENPLLSGGT